MSDRDETPTPPQTSAELYLDLLKGVLTRDLFIEPTERQIVYRDLRADNWKRHVLAPVQALLARRGYRLVARREGPALRELRAQGMDWPQHAETMIGRRRIDSLQECVETVLADDVPGDLIETGVWRGGAVIFMRAVLAAHGVTDRTVWAADSFQGLPQATLPVDVPDDLSDHPELAVDLEAVKANFRRYGLLDEQVRFVVGWFKDSLPVAPIGKLALARLDGDYYESTWDAIKILYPKLSPGGFLVVDDYGQIEGCRRAIDDFREREAITDPVRQIDHSGIYWRVGSSAAGRARANYGVSAVRDEKRWRTRSRSSAL